MKAVKLREVDHDYRNHLQAYLNFSAKARRKSGKPVYRTFTKFYNYNRELDKVMRDRKSRFGKGYNEFVKQKKGEVSHGR